MFAQYLRDDLLIDGAWITSEEIVEGYEEWAGLAGIAMIPTPLFLATFASTDGVVATRRRLMTSDMEPVRRRLSLRAKLRGETMQEKASLYWVMTADELESRFRQSLADQPSPPAKPRRVPKVRVAEDVPLPRAA